MDKYIILSEAKPHKYYKIVEVQNKNINDLRLMELGFVVGQVIFLKAIAPLKTTFLINILGYDLGIRRQQANNIFVVEVKRL